MLAVTAYAMQGDREKILRSGFDGYLSKPVKSRALFEALDRLRVGVHALGYIARTTQEAIDDFFPGYARAVASVAKERGWPAVSRAGFEAQRTRDGALLVGNSEGVVEKIVRHSEALGGISRLTFQMNAASLSHAKLMRAIEAIGTRVVPALRERLANESNLSEKAAS